MIKSQLIPNINLFERIQSSKLDMGPSLNTMRIEQVEKPETQNFKSVFSGLVENLNTEMNAPDTLMQDLAMGKSNVDIHDVTTAMAKAEIGVNMATTVTTKVLQTYEKIMQIQV